MIEYFTFKHSGEMDSYKDEIYLTVVPSVTVAIFYGSALQTASKVSPEMFSGLLAEVNPDPDFNRMCSVLDSKLPGNAEYLVLRIEGSRIACFRRGGVAAKIVLGGDLKMLPNGIFGLNEGDRILVATDNFFSHLTDEGILADALVTDSCSDWMNLLVRRISDVNQLKCGNLSAVTLLVR